MTVTIYHNPRCSKSRQTLALLQERGVTPTVVEYLKTPPDAATLGDILPSSAARLASSCALKRRSTASWV